MGWLLVGCFGLAFINISGALNNPPITQTPRFLGLKIKSKAAFFCTPSNQTLVNSVQWYKVQKYNEERHKAKQVKEEKRISFVTLDRHATLYINDLRTEDRGVYFCKIQDKWGPGSELQVARPVNISEALYRAKMKDGLMIIQGLLLAACVAAIMLRKRKLQLEKTDSLYEEPETDHIYEGLAIETCGGGLYEELSAYAQPEGAEAPWE